jgi:feruloyl esterase
MRGSELLWGSASGNGHMVAHAPYSSGEFLQYAVFQDANWDFRTFDFDRDLARADRLDGGLMNNIDPNLSDFFGRGGKLLQYHGWGDPGISPLSSIDYFSSVAKLMGGPAAVQNSYRLFMVPSMGHCWYGDGPTSFDPISAIDQWVEKGTAPDRIIASRWVDGKIDRTRPLCPYPQVAAYKGNGSTDATNNFVCKIR